jgi:hypothetical protein
MQCKEQVKETALTPRAITLSSTPPTCPEWIPVVHAGRVDPAKVLVYGGCLPIYPIIPYLAGQNPFVLEGPGSGVIRLRGSKGQIAIVVGHGSHSSAMTESLKALLRRSKRSNVARRETEGGDVSESVR